MSTKRRLLVVFVDALGPAQVERFGESLRFLPHRASLHGIFGYSSGALPTILTGEPPSVHGRMCLFSKLPKGETSILSPLSWLGLLPRALHERSALRGRLARLFARSNGLTGYVALHRVPPRLFRDLDLPEREDLFQSDTIGGATTFLSEAREAGLEVFAAPWQLPEPTRWERTHAVLRATQPDLTFLYAAALDATLHRTGNQATEAREVLSDIADHIERAKAALERGGGEVTTWVVGDHGMADVRTTLDPRGVVRALESMEVQAFVDSTLLRMWGTPKALERAERHLLQRAWPGRWLDESALAERDAPVSGYPYGRAMFLLREGVIFAPSYVGGRAKGMHGYDPADFSATAALLSDAPLPAACSGLTSIAPLVRRSLGLPVAPPGPQGTQP